MSDEPTPQREPTTVECPAGHENRPEDLRNPGMDYLCPDCAAEIDPGRVLAAAGDWP